MSTELIVKALDELAVLRSKRADIGAKFQAKRDKLLKPHQPLFAKVQATRADEADAVKDLSADIEKAEKEITEAVIKHAETVKGDELMAVFVKGKTSWNESFLEGLAETVPAIAKAKVTGKPSVQFRQVKAATPPAA